ncbi:MAG: extracellular solute-binding protein [Clostridiales bacterium]|nr:extracellular solute-binding protein [Clostridiales bacterium]
MKKHFVKIFALLAAALCVGAVAGCGTDTKNDPSKLTVWVVAPFVHNYAQVLKTKPNDRQAKMSQIIFEEYAAEHSDIKLDLQNKGWGTELNQALTKAIAGNTAPDVTVGEMYVPSYVANNHFIALDFGAEIEGDIIEQTAAYGKGADGKWYAAPVWTGTFGLSINVTVLKDAQILNADGTVKDEEIIAAGIDPLHPAYWEDLLTICTKIKTYFKEKGDDYTGGMLVSNTHEGGAWRALAYQRTAGGEISEDNTTMVMDTPANEKAYRMMRDLSKTSPDGALNASNEEVLWTQYFFPNKAAYIVDGIDPIVRAGYFDGAGEIVPAELPTFKEDGKKSNVLVGTGYFSIVAKRNKSDFTKEQEFIRFLLKKENQIRLLDADIRVPTRKSVLNSDEIKAAPDYDVKKPFVEPIVNSAYSFNGGIPSFLKNPATVWSQYDYFLDDVFKKDASVASLLTDAQKAMTDAYNE